MSEERTEEQFAPEPQPDEEKSLKEQEASVEPETAPDSTEEMPQPKDEKPEDTGNQDKQAEVSQEPEDAEELEITEEAEEAETEELTEATEEVNEVQQEEEEKEESIEESAPEEIEEEPSFVVKQEDEIIMEGDIPEDDEREDDYTSEERRAMLERMEETVTDLKEGEIIDGKILRINNDEVIVDIGFKSEGIVPKSEFREDIEVGDEVSVFLEELEDEEGHVIVSKRKADFVKVWEEIRNAYENATIIEGRIKKRIKGGMVVDLMGVEAFLPGSQISLRQVPDFDALVGDNMEFRVIKLNKLRRNIVVSRRVVLEEERKEKRQELLAEIEEDQIVEGTVKNITDFGAFIDLGGLDGLLHITDMSWSRIQHPSEILKIGDDIRIKILKYDKKKERISLGLKQLTPSPWEAVEEKYPEGARIKGKVVNITKYGAFIELEEGVEGLVHISEMSWTKHINHPSELLSVGEEISVVVLSVDKENQKISLGIKHLEPDPWTLLAAKYPPGSRIAGVVRNLTSFGAFIEVEDGIDGLVHISDMSWTKRIMHPSEIISKGEEIEAVVLNIEPDKRRVSLGIKQLGKDPWPELEGRYSVGRETEGRIIRMSDRGVTVKLPDNVEGFVPVTQLGKEVNRPADAFSEGDLLPLKVIEFDKTDRRIVLSVNAFFESKEQTDLDRYLAAHSIKTVSIGEALGDIIPSMEANESEVTDEIPEESGVEAEIIDSIETESEETPNDEVSTEADSDTSDEEISDEETQEDEAETTEEVKEEAEEEEIQSEEEISPEPADEQPAEEEQKEEESDEKTEIEVTEEVAELEQPEEENQEESDEEKPEEASEETSEVEKTEDEPEESDDDSDEEQKEE